MSRGAGSRSAGKNIVIIGGGTGTSNLLAGFKGLFANVSVVNCTSDNGASTGILRDDLDILPVGDIRKCLLAASDMPEFYKQVLSYRFEKGHLKGFAVGNVVLAAAMLLEKNPNVAISKISGPWKVKNKIIPVSQKATTLAAIMSNGRKIISEHKIDEYLLNGKGKVKKIMLVKPVAPNPEAVKAILNANVLCIGPGDLYTSVLPNFLVKGITQAVLKSSAKKVFVANIFNKPGHTDRYSVEDYLNVFEKYLGKKNIFDFVIENIEKPSKKISSVHAKIGADLVRGYRLEALKTKIKVISKKLLSNKIQIHSKADTVFRSVVLHDSKKLAKIIFEI